MLSWASKPGARVRHDCPENGRQRLSSNDCNARIDQQAAQFHAQVHQINARRAATVALVLAVLSSTMGLSSGTVARVARVVVGVLLAAHCAAALPRVVPSALAHCVGRFRQADAK